MTLSPHFIVNTICVLTPKFSRTDAYKLHHGGAQMGEKTKYFLRAIQATTTYVANSFQYVHIHLAALPRCFHFIILSLTDLYENLNMSLFRL